MDSNAKVRVKLEKDTLQFLEIRHMLANHSNLQIVEQVPLNLSPEEIYITSSAASLQALNSRPRRAYVIAIVEQIDAKTIRQLYRQGVYDCLSIEEIGELPCILSQIKDKNKELSRASNISEAHYQAILDSVTEPVYIVNTQQELIACNETFRENVKRITGRSPHLGGSLMKGLSGEEQHFWHSFEQEMVKKGQATRQRCYEYQSETLIYEISGCAVWQEQRLRGFVYYAQDITARKKAVELQRRYHNILNQLPIHIFEKDKQGRFSFMNHKTLEMLKLNLEDVIGKTDHDIFPPEVAKSLIQHDQAIRQKGSQHARAQEEVMTINGKRRYLLADKVLLDPENPQESSLLGYSVDITERKEAENALNEQKDFIRRVIDTDPNLIFVKDKYGNFLLANQAVAKLFNTTPDKLQNVANDAIHHNQQEVDDYNEVDQKVIEEKRTIVLEEPFTLSNGKKVYYRTTKTPIKASNGEWNVLAISVDITQEITTREKEKQAKARKEAQEKAIKAAMLKGQEQERERISRELHDSVSQMLSSVLLQLNEVENSASKRQVRSSRQNLEKVRELISSTMQEIREISQNLMPKVLSDFGLQDALEQLKITLENQQIIQIDLDIFTIQTHYDKNLEIAIYRITQEAISNIIRHAQANRVTIQLIEHEDMLQLLIEDNGIGFDQRLKQRSKGYGLINIEQRVLTLGGQVRIESNPNSGTAIIVEIPLVFS